MQSPRTYSVALAWNPNPDSCVAGYALSAAPSGSYSSRIDVGTNTTVTVSGLTGGQTNYFAVTAYNAALVESAPAGEAMYIVPGIVLLTPASRPGDPVTLTFPVAPGHWYDIQASVDLKSWTTIQQTATATTNGWVQFLDPQAGAFQMRFYRLVLH